MFSRVFHIGCDLCKSSIDKKKKKENINEDKPYNNGKFTTFMFLTITKRIHNSRYN